MSERCDAEPRNLNLPRRQTSETALALHARTPLAALSYWRCLVGGGSALGAPNIPSSSDASPLWSAFPRGQAFGPASDVGSHSLRIPTTCLW